jgi:hypothetical protein
MESSDAALIYVHFVHQVAVSKRAWSLECQGDLCAVYGAGPPMFPLWPDLESAHYFRGQCWPDLELREIPLHHLLWRYLPPLVRAGVPVGVGVAPYPEAVVLPAQEVRLDLIGARRGLTRRCS